MKVTGQVRQGGRWTPWQELDADQPAKRGPRTGTSLVWAGPSHGVEVGLAIAELRQRLS